MEHSPNWEGDVYSAIQVIHHSLRHGEFQLSIPNSPPMDTLLRQINPVHVLLMITFNIIL